MLFGDINFAATITVRTNQGTTSTFTVTQWIGTTTTFTATSTTVLGGSQVTTTVTSVYQPTTVTLGGLPSATSTSDTSQGIRKYGVGEWQIIFRLDGPCSLGVLYRRCRFGTDIGRPQALNFVLPGKRGAVLFPPRGFSKDGAGIACTVQLILTIDNIQGGSWVLDDMYPEHPQRGDIDAHSSSVLIWSDFITRIYLNSEFTLQVWTCNSFCHAPFGFWCNCHRAHS